MLANKLGTTYTPKARPLNDDRSFWLQLSLRPGEHRQWLENDLYENTEAIMGELIAYSEDRQSRQQILVEIATESGKPAQFLGFSHSLQRLGSGGGRQAVYETVIESLRDPSHEVEAKYQLLHSALAILGKGFQGGQPLKLNPTIQILPFVTDLQKSSNKDFQKTAQEFVEQFTDCE